MGNRLSRIVTRTGDDGTTSLGDGTRLPKDSPRIEAIGTVDELNSLLGLVIALSPAPAEGTLKEPGPRDWLLDVQHDLFDLGAELSVPGLSRIDEDRVIALERHVEELNARLPPLKEFVLPGGSTAAAVCHLARTLCRRAERRCWALNRAASEPAAADAATALPAQAGLNLASLRYLNRLSDLLFVQARVYARSAGGSEVLWRYRRGQSSD